MQNITRHRIACIFSMCKKIESILGLVSTNTNKNIETVHGVGSIIIISNADTDDNMTKYLRN